MLLSLQAKISANILISPFLYVSLHSLLADMAQLVEQRIRNAQVPGSSPGIGSLKRDATKAKFIITKLLKYIQAELAHRQCTGFPSLGGGFDSRIPLTFPISVSFLIDKKSERISFFPTLITLYFGAVLKPSCKSILGSVGKRWGLCIQVFDSKQKETFVSDSSQIRSE